MQTREIAITHPLGLHARACARIVQVASRFRCKVSRMSDTIATIAAISSGPSVSTTIVVPTAAASSITATMLCALARRTPLTSDTLHRKRDATWTMRAQARA